MLEHAADTSGSFLPTLWVGIQHAEPLAQCGPWHLCTVRLVVFTMAIFILYLSLWPQTYNKERLSHQTHFSVFKLTY